MKLIVTHGFLIHLFISSTEAIFKSEAGNNQISGKWRQKHKIIAERPWEQDFVVFSHVSVREEEITELLPKIEYSARLYILNGLAEKQANEDGNLTSIKVSMSV